MDTKQLLDDLFAGNEVTPPRRFLIIVNGNTVWADYLQLDPETNEVAGIIEISEKKAVFIDLKGQIDLIYDFSPEFVPIEPQKGPDERMFI